MATLIILSLIAIFTFLIAVFLLYIIKQEYFYKSENEPIIKDKTYHFIDNGKPPPPGPPPPCRK